MCVCSSFRTNAKIQAKSTKCHQCILQRIRSTKCSKKLDDSNQKESIHNHPKCYCRINSVRVKKLNRNKVILYIFSICHSSHHHGDESQSQFWDFQDLCHFEKIAYFEIHHPESNRILMRDRVF